MQRKVHINVSKLRQSKLQIQQVPLAESGQDNGFVYRIFVWFYFYCLSEVFDFEIFIDHYFFQEGLFLELPKTKFVEPDYFKGFNIVQITNNIMKDETKNLLSLGDFSNIKSVTEVFTTLRSFVNSQNSFFNNNETLCWSEGTCAFKSIKDLLVQGQEFLNVIEQCDDSYSIFGKIKFKKEEVNNFLERKFSNITGMQIRRGAGVKLTKEYLDDLKQHVDKKTIESYYNTISLFQGPAAHYIVIPDDFYYKKIEKILEYDRTKIIYLSHDVPKIFIDHFIKKYPRNIVTKKDYENEFLSYFSEFDLVNKNQNGYNLKRLLLNLLDLFALCYSNEILLIRGPSFSSWPGFANMFKPKKVIYS